MTRIPFNGIIGDEITEAGIREALDRAKGGDVELIVNSTGGSVVVGLGLYEMLKAYEGSVSAHVTGIAASMASVILCACSYVRAEPSASLFLHLPAMVTSGNEVDHEKSASILRGFSAALVGIYCKKTGKTPEAMRAILEADSWFFGNQMLTSGLVDQITGPVLASATSFATIAATKRNYSMTAKSRTTSAESLERALLQMRASSAPYMVSNSGLVTGGTKSLLLRDWLQS